MKKLSEDILIDKPPTLGKLVDGARDKEAKLKSLFNKASSPSQTSQSDCETERQ